MSFPNLISAVDSNVNSKPGPWKSANGARYSVLTDGVILIMFKSADAGVTWATVDAANGPAISDGAPGFTGDIGNGFIYVASSNADNTFMQVSRFNTATDKWENNTITTNAITGGTYRVMCAMYRVSDGGLIVGMNLPSISNAGFIRTAFFVFNTTALTWTGFAPMGRNGAEALEWEVNGIVAGPGTETEFMFLSRLFTPGGARTLWRQSLSGTNVLGALVTLSTITDGGSTIPTPAWFSDGVNIMGIWNPTNVSPMQVIVLVATAAALVFTPTVINGPATDTSIDAMGVVVDSNENLLAFIASNNAEVAPITENFTISTNLGEFVAIGSTTPSNTGNNDNLWLNALGTAPYGMVMQNGQDMQYWEAVGIAAPVVLLPLNPVFIPFPWGPQCCDPCSDDVACLRPMADGRIYLNAKGAVRKVGT